MAAKPAPPEIRVAPTENGHKVRPDLQTKVITGVILFVFLGTLGWIGGKVADLSDRMVRVETTLDLRFSELLRSMERFNVRLEKVETKLDKENR